MSNCSRIKAVRDIADKNNPISVEASEVKFDYYAEDVFNEDALIFSGVKSEYITLRSDDHNRTVKFALGGAPWLGIWAKPGAPYVCIEPWCGVNDSQIKKNDFSEKDGINAIAKGESWNFTWSAEFSE
jgi:galactose mutarotase-like enzyme